MGTTALREWDQETGIPRGRLKIIPGKHVDDPTVGARLLVAICDPSSGTPDPVTDEAEWTPPEAHTRCPNGHQMISRHTAKGGESCSCCQTYVLGATGMMLSSLLACDACRFCVCKNCQDPGPTVASYWMHVDRARGGLKEEKRIILENAIDMLPWSIRGGKACRALI